MNYRSLRLSRNFVGPLFILGAALFFLPGRAQAITIDSATVTPSSLDSIGNPVLPYFLNYGLSTNADVTLSVKNASGAVVRHLVTNQLQSSEAIGFHSVPWDGLNDSGQAVPIAIYTFVFDATDPNTNTQAPEVTVALAVTSMPGVAFDARKAFESNAYVFPNPVRGGLASFAYQAVRDNATVTLKIYTLNKQLVLSQTLISGATAGTYTWPTSGSWDVTNQSGKKLGRGLYFCVFREEDSVGTLETVKKLAVIR